MTQLETYPIFEAIPVWVLDPDSSVGPQWRRCQISLSMAAGRPWFRVTIRRRRDGASVEELFKSYAFRGCLDSIFENIMRGVFADELARVHGIIPTHRPGWIIHNHTAGYSNDGSASPVIAFQLRNEPQVLLTNLPQHRRLALLQSAQRVAAAQDLRRKRL